MKVETLNKLIDATNVVSKDVTRYTLNNVLIEKVNDETIKIVATDGHMLSMVEANEPLIAQKLPRNGILIHPDKIKIIKAVKPKLIYSSELTDTHLIINGINLKIEKNRDYPKYMDVVPDYSNNETIKLSLNVDYLERLLKAVREDKKENGVIMTIDAGNPKKAVLIEARGQKIGTGVLMPMRI